MTKTKAVEIARPTNESQLHLYVAWGCPFCHRVLAAIALAGVGQPVTYTWMRNVKGPAGWEIAPGDDPLFGETSLKAIYERLEPGVDHTPSVPLLVDLSAKTLLSSSSPHITRFFASGMGGVYPVDRELAPAALVDRVDSLNAWLHEHVNRAVYRVGFATEQSDYEEKVAQLFQALDDLETRLAGQPYLLGDTLTESDLYLLATLVRFDSVYYPLFGCDCRRIADYPVLSRYLERLLAMDGIDATYDRELIEEHYFLSVMHVGGEVRNLTPSRRVGLCKLERGG